MKLTWIFAIFLLSFVSYGEPLEIENIYKKWQSFSKSGEISNFGTRETKPSVKLLYGESFKKTDHIRNAKLLSSKVENNKLILTFEFPEVILDIFEVEALGEDDYLKICKNAVFPVDSNVDYEVEFYGIHQVKTSKAKAGINQGPKLFAKLKLLSRQNWLGLLRKQLEVEDASSEGLKKFLLSEIPVFNVKSADYEEIGALLKKTFQENGYKLIFMPGSQDPDNIKKYGLNLKDVPVIELVQRIASIENLKYRLGEKDVIIASSEAFKRSKTMRNKDGLDLPGLKVDVKNKVMKLDAKVCLDSGILEYLMCMPHSFEHESVFVTKVKPELIHMGLLLVQAKQMPYNNRREIMKLLKANKSRLKIEVEWYEDGEVNKVDLNKLLIDRSQKDKKTLAEDLWFFAGSFFTEKNVYAANLHQSIISLQQHPASVIHYGKESEDPYRSKRGGFEVNHKLCPPMNSEVKLIFSLHP